MPADPALLAMGSALRSAREDSGLSQEALAERAGFHRTYVGGVERGERNPTLLTLLRLAEALDTTLSSLARDFERRLGR